MYVHIYVARLVKINPRIVLYLLWQTHPVLTTVTVMPTNKTGTRIMALIMPMISAAEPVPIGL